MILGIDVGGTHTDAVLLKGRRLHKKTKTRTQPGHLVSSFLDAADRLLAGEDLDAIERVTVSTTLSTNAITQNKLERVGMVVSPGPGLAPSCLPRFDNVYILSGYMNHRGIEAAPLDQAELKNIADDLRQKGIRRAGAVGKFSCRNPKHEMEILAAMESVTDHVSLGHRLSGQLNFPRRMATTYVNAAVWSLHARFVQDVEAFIRDRGIGAPVYILKADGGTFSLSRSRTFPAQTILSGPAASIMGTLNTFSAAEDAVVLDIGGTTTDIAVFADGVPLLEPLGVTLGSYRTLIRGLRTCSIGIGGDSVVTVSNRRLVIGPERKGPAAALGGAAATPTDAMIVSGRLDLGCREAAVAVLEPIAGTLKCSTGEAAERIFAQTCDTITTAVREVIAKVNNQPVYTIHELLEGKIVAPRLLYVVGGPAHVMAMPLGERLGCTVHVPDHAEVANAIGAALSRVTAEVTILADTEQGTLTIGEEGRQTPISSRFTREEAISVARNKLEEMAVDLGADRHNLALEITEDQVFPMVRDFTTTGKNIRIKAQIKPGLLFRLEGGPSA